ncbi:universal stress protein [Inmirania thermothiophila]|uniref:Nucleotide-binding universal stress UspA family protein n=1 Tax=Inmirania thermothiophila TaxID=1750597 RepID=A0A3N1Y211_9GAMM|nr:universal stress protein [Inmirania thermothiophila]ROR32883.1 nucleotide-binding universal stress UspA family protein [Inmirania thermothiophila]
MFRNILLPVNLTEGPHSPRALEAALEYARRDGAHLYVLEVLPDYGLPVVASFFPPEARAAAVRETEQQLADFVRRHVPEGVAVTAVVREGRPYEQILEEAGRHRIDLIVIPSRHMGTMEGFLLGSTAEKVVRHARCSVLVVRD